jgi:catechol 2,3-dioxygenase-like lactoylglutathione lyase family enzyme
MTLPSGAEAARPFLPAEDLAVSTAFYERLGFRKLLDSDVAIFAIGATAFIVAPQPVGGHGAENMMMQLMVDDLDAWWGHIQALDLPGAFGVPPPQAPAMQPWGLRVAYLVDPGGVLWHIAERRPGKAWD